MQGLGVLVGHKRLKPIVIGVLIIEEQLEAIVCPFGCLSTRGLAGAREASYFHTKGQQHFAVLLYHVWEMT